MKNVAEMDGVQTGILKIFSGALPPNPQDLSLLTEPVISGQTIQEVRRNGNDYRFWTPDARVASQHGPILPVTEYILHGKSQTMRELPLNFSNIWMMQ